MAACVRVGLMELVSMETASVSLVMHTCSSCQNSHTFYLFNSPNLRPMLCSLQTLMNVLKELTTVIRQMLSALILLVASSALVTRASLEMASRAQVGIDMVILHLQICLTKYTSHAHA